MIEFLNIFPEWVQLYLLVGVVVYLVVCKSFAYRCANNVSGAVSGHPVSSYRDQGKEPTWFDYMVCLGWAPPMIAGWPLVLYVYITGSNHPEDKNQRR